MLQSQTHLLPAGAMHPRRQHADRRRLAKVIDLARIYRNCGVKELADLVRRDKTRLVPETGNPKVDLVASLARVLEWPIRDVVDAIRGNQSRTSGPILRSRRTFSQLDEMAVRAHDSGHWRVLEGIARALALSARTSRERMVACYRQGLALESTGRYGEALRHFQAGLNLRHAGREARILLRTNLANAHLHLGNLLEARSVATEVLHEIESEAATSSTLFNQSTTAFALYIRGNVQRKQITGTGTPPTADAAIEDLIQARNAYHQLCRYGNSRSFRGLARTCEGALIELETVTGRLDPRCALDRIQEHLDMMEHPLHRDNQVGDLLESHGWWAIFGANIAWHQLQGTERSRRSTEFAERTLAIGDRLGHVGFQATGFSVLYRIDRTARDAGQEPAPWSITPERLARLVRVMGCLPEFRTTGWRILEETGALEHATTIDPRTWRKGLQGA